MIGVLRTQPHLDGMAGEFYILLHKPQRLAAGNAQLQLDEIETWWAMTIHKSQGSEFRQVVITLPPAPSPVLTRELLYTAVTRAKEHVTVVASEASLRAAIARPVARASGLGAQLHPA